MSLTPRQRELLKCVKDAPRGHISFDAAAYEMGTTPQAIGVIVKGLLMKEDSVYLHGTEIWLEVEEGAEKQLSKAMTIREAIRQLQWAANHLPDGLDSKLLIATSDEFYGARELQPEKIMPVHTEEGALAYLGTRGEFDHLHPNALETFWGVDSDER